MATEQNMTQAIMQATIGAAKIAIMVAKGVENPPSTARPLQMMPKAFHLALKQSTFNWRLPDTRNSKTSN